MTTDYKCKTLFVPDASHPEYSEHAKICGTYLHKTTQEQHVLYSIVLYSIILRIYIYIYLK